MRQTAPVASAATPPTHAGRRPPMRLGAHPPRAALVLTLAGLLQAAQAAQTARADTPADWFDFADKIASDASPDPDAQSTPAEDRAQSRTMLAMFEAVRAIHPDYASYLHMPPAPAGLSEAAAANAAAHAVLLATFPAMRTQIDAFEAQHLAAVPAGAARTGGIALGEQAAALVLRRPVLDPAMTVAEYRPVTRPGVWVPTALPSIPAYLPAMQPWFMAHSDALRPAPPVAIGSAAFAADYNETRRLGARDSTLRTAEQTRSAQFWARYDTTAAVRAVADRPGRTLVQNCRFFAVLAMGEDDVGSTLSDAKMHYMFWRPITAIRNGDRTGNPATLRDAGWLPLLHTPLHPEYPCGHCVQASFLATLLAAEPGGTAQTRYTFKTQAPGHATQSLTLADYETVASDARIWGGVHFRSTAQISKALGRRLAGNAIARFAPGVTPAPRN